MGIKAASDAVETCPYCDGPNLFQNYNAEEDGYIVRCQDCGEEMMLCDECRHAEDNPYMKCDWHEEHKGDVIYSICFRGTTTHKEV